MKNHFSVGKFELSRHFSSKAWKRRSALTLELAVHRQLIAERAGPREWYSTPHGHTPLGGSFAPMTAKYGRRTESLHEYSVMAPACHVRHFRANDGQIWACALNYCVSRRVTSAMHARHCERGALVRRGMPTGGFTWPHSSLFWRTIQHLL
jgi:hypothetical protein